jgi:NDP-sugar pyrophosphorylase family protein
MAGPILVILAAGMGSRYGGLKQMDPIGAAGEVLLDYSVYDALRSGFKKIVFIIRRDFEDDFKRLVLGRMGAGFDYALAFQENDTLIPPAILESSRQAGRTKPWGTAHALLCAAPFIDAPFAVINADDFYGREAFQVMGGCLARENLDEGVIVPYALEKTLSPRGTVTRGVCVISGGLLQTVEELKSIEKQGGIIFNTGPGGEKRELAPDTPVSMNCWGFPPGILPDLGRYFEEFLRNSGGEPKSECYIPLAADWLIKNDLLKIRSLDANSEWFGVTYKEDKEAAQRRMAELTGAGVYPSPLWAR